MPELLEPAALELIDTAAWYESRREGYGSRFLDEAEEIFELIDANPLLAPPWRLDGIPAGVRHVAMRTFPVSIVLVTDPRTVVVAIVGSQDPAYWIDRLEALE